MARDATAITVYQSTTFGLFGFRLPYLPDFLADHTLLGEAPADRLAECCRRWEYLVGSLWSADRPAAYGLRFTYDPRTGATDALLLGRADDGADEVAAGLQRALAALRISTVPLGMEELSAARRAEAAHVFEVRQAEQLVAVRTAEFGRSPDEYLVLPWWGPGGSFIGPASALAAGSTAPVALAVVLQPTDLPEAAGLADVAARMATAAGKSTEGVVIGTESARQEHNMDPQAEWLGRVYAANLRRLHRPFLVAAYALSDDPLAARGVADALAAAIGDERPFEPPIGEPSVLPSRADVRALDGVMREDALRAVGELEFAFGPTRAPDHRPAVRRLRYLCDARGAATAFRLPVSVNGGVPGIAVRQRSPDFHPGPRTSTRPADHIELGRYEGGGLATVPIADLTKHVLVTGFTGSGKTVTVLQLLHQLWADHDIPFLVLESAKQEYRGLFGVREVGPDLRVYTLGNETAVPFRLNPFELLPGVRVEAHLSRLQVCMEAAVPPIGPSASVIAEALLRVYERCGWALTDVYPEESVSSRRFPQFGEFVAAIERVIVERKYTGETLANLTAALVGRFRPLLLGSKRLMFDTPRSVPGPADLFCRPVVLEMNDLNVDDKALVVMFVLTFLREYREREFRRRVRGTGPLVHVTLVEEAHNVLENVASKGTGDGATAADTRFKAVEAFCQLLTEIRALGEGLIVADQSPEKLAPDAMRNTNLQIAHQLRDGNDRAAVANAMIMTDEQRDFLGKLRPGQAAVFRTGLERATFVAVPQYYPTAEQAARVPLDPGAAKRHRERFRGWGFSSNLSDADLIQKMAEKDPALKTRPVRVPFVGCAHCQSHCRYRDAIAGEVCGVTRSAEVLAFHKAFDDAKISQDEVWRLAAVAALAGTDRAKLPRTPDASWCHFLHAWHGRFGTETAPKHQVSPSMHKRFLAMLASVSQTPRSGGS